MRSGRAGDENKLKMPPSKHAYNEAPDVGQQCTGYQVHLEQGLEPIERSRRRPADHSCNRSGYESYNRLLSNILPTQKR